MPGKSTATASAPAMATMCRGSCSARIAQRDDAAILVVGNVGGGEAGDDLRTRLVGRQDDREEAHGDGVGRGWCGTSNAAPLINARSRYPSSASRSSRSSAPPPIVT